MSFEQQRQYLQNIAPFNVCPTNILTQLSGALDVVYFQIGNTFDISLSENAHLYFVIKGQVAEFDSEHRHQATYGANTFFGEAVLLKQVQTLHYEIVEEAILYRLPSASFQLCLAEEQVKGFFVDDITTKLNKHHSQLQAESSSEMMMASVSIAPLNPLLELNEKESIASCVAKMNEIKSDACIVRKVDGELGIVTISDLLNSLVISKVSLESHIGPWAKFPVVTIHQLDYLFNALLKMTQFHINRLAVRNDDGLIGFLHQKELMSVFANQSGLVTFSIQQASHIEDLKQAMTQIEDLVSSLFTRGVKTHYIAKLVNALHRKVLEKVYHLVDVEQRFGDACFVVMGSEGRAEQVLRTDQDNALLFPNNLDVSEPLLQTFSHKLTQALLDLGFPPCPGNIMVSNPVWAKTTQDFIAQIRAWLRSPSEQSFMNLAIFYDAEPVCGDDELLKQARQAVLDYVGGHAEFLSHFAKPVLQFETPVSFFGSLITQKTGHEAKIDIKKGGVFPIVHGIRCLAMEYGITKTNTHWRIKALMDRKVLSETFGLELGETLNYLNSLRLEAMLKSLHTGKAIDNYVRVDQLSPTQQGLLKDSFLVVNRFKKLIEHHFKLQRVL